MKAKYLNQEIRKAIKDKGLTNYQVAHAVGISPITFEAWLQCELNPERRARVMQALEKEPGARAEDLNTDIKQRIKSEGLKNYQVAYAIGITNVTFARWLQRELEPEKRGRVLVAIEEIKEKEFSPANEQIREAIRAKGLCNYEVAHELHITPCTFSRWLQTELPPKGRERVQKAIERITK